MEVIFELLFEVVAQFFGEFVLDAGFRGTAKALKNRVVRGVVGVVLGAAAGFGGGYWWGARLTEAGRTDPPSSLWVSMAMATAFATLAVVGLIRGRSRSQPASPLSPPWRWSAGRLVGFALLNVAVAAGIAAGFDPQSLR